MDPQTFEVAGRATRLALAEGWEDAWPRFDQDHPRELGVDVPEVARQRESAHLAQGPGEFDASRPAADHDEGQQSAAAFGVGFPFGLFEGTEHATSDLGGLFQGLQPRGVFLPVVVPEVRVARPAGEEQRVVVDFPGPGDDAPMGQIDAVDLFLTDVDVLVSREKTANRRGDLGGAESGHRHLVEEGLEQVVIALVDEGDLDLRNVAERACGAKARKSSAHNHHAFHCRPPKTTK